MNGDGVVPFDLSITLLLSRPLGPGLPVNGCPQGLACWQGGQHSVATSVHNMISVFF